MEAAAMTDVPDGPLEPPEATVPRRWCDLCRNWDACPCGCGWGWCSYANEFTIADGGEECGDFDGDPPEFGDDPAWDEIREEGTSR